MKRYKKIIAILFLLALIIGLYGLYEFNRNTTGLEGTSPDKTETATNMIQQFETNNVSASQFYQEKIVLVTGEVISTDTLGTVALVTLGKPQSSISVSCQMDSTYKNPLPAKGSIATIKGKYIGFSENELIGSDIILGKCLLQKKL